MANLREIALKNKSPDIYRVHHGNVSALLRETTEDEMKAEDEKIVTGATVTLELGIDIGALDQAVQVGAPHSVASFAQRLGRCGRRGQVPQLLFTFVENIVINAADILGPINWDFLKTLAIIDLYTKEHWIEPIYPHHHHYALLYHQTMGFLKSNGETSPAALATAVLGLGTFRHIPQEDYRRLLSHMVDIQQLERTERGGLIIGRQGEKQVSSHKFLTVFKAPEYLLVKDENRTIGTVDTVYPVGTRFSLAGMTWEVLDVNEKSKVIFVKKVPGVSMVDWEANFDGELHTVLVCKIRQILLSDAMYPYLSESCRERIAELRYITQNSGILDNLVTQISNKKFAVFPWMGTRQLLTLHYALLDRGVPNKIPWYTCVYIEAIFGGTVEELEAIIRDIARSDIDLYGLPLPDNAQVRAKYNEFVPKDLLKKQFVEDYLDMEGVRQALSKRV
jgi:ATP-dependent Lhr-like helicase